MRLFLFLFSIMILTAFPAMAQEIYECGVPDAPKLEKTEDPELWRYCDYHSRRFQYAAEQKEFRRTLEERRENFVKYREAAIHKYKDDLENYHASIE